MYFIKKRRNAAKGSGLSEDNPGFYTDVSYLGATWEQAILT
jgi:hypothetical protein